MTATAEAVVIGGGILGTSAAFHLARAGMKVTLLERAFVGAGATGKSHSIVRLHYTNPHDAALAKLSLPYFQHWNDLVGTGDCGFVRTGALRAVKPSEEHKLRGNVAMLRGLGIETWIVGREEMRAIDPGLVVDDLTCAAWEPIAGYADPLATANGFAIAAVNHGAVIHEGIGATAITVERGRVVGVETTDGTIATDAVLVANGAWAPPLLAPLGFAVPLAPKRVQITVFRRPLADRGPQPILFDGVLGIVVRPDGASDTLVAIGFEPAPVDPDAYDEGIDPAFIADCRARIAKRRPAMAAAVSRGGWAGVAPESPDGHIVLDCLPDARGVYVAVGCSGTNFKTGPGIGKCLAEWMTEGEPRSADLRAFRASRFAEGAPISGAYEYGAGAADVWR